MCTRAGFQIFPDTESAGLRIEHRDKCRIASVKIDRYLFPAAFGEGAQIIRKGDFQFLVPPRVAVGGGEEKMLFPAVSIQAVTVPEIPPAIAARMGYVPFIEFPVHIIPAAEQGQDDLQPLIRVG